MAVTCSIPNCQNDSPNVIYFKIPMNVYIRYKWLLSIKQSYPYFSMTNSCNQYVCSKHFEDQYFELPNKQSLKSIAIPTVFENGSYTYIDIFGLFDFRPIDNIAAGMNTEHCISAFVHKHNKVDTNAAKSVKVISQPKLSNTKETRSTTRNLRNNKLPVEHVQHKEFSKHMSVVAKASSKSRLLQTRKRRYECEFCNSENSEERKIPM